MKTLILSCNTGAGHNSCARAIQEVYHANGEVCDIADALEFISERASAFISNWHTRIYRHAPRLFRAGYAGAENHESLFREGTPVYRYLTSGVERMAEYIRENGYDNIICTHVFPALALTELRRRHTDAAFVASYVSTDYTCTPSTGDSALDFYFIPDASLAGAFVAGGVSEEKLVPSGLPAAQKFYAPGSKQAARRALGLPESSRQMLMMCGSMGCGPMQEMAEQIRRQLRTDEYLTIACGTNKKLLAKLQKAFADCPQIAAVGKLPDVPGMMRACDLFLTKPGGLSTTEAAASGLPMVLIDAVAGCEEHNLAYFLRLGGAVTADTPQALCDVALQTLRDDAKLAAMTAALHRPEDGQTPAEKIYSRLALTASERAQEA